IVLEDKPSTTSFSKRERTRFYKLIHLDRKLLMSARALLIQALYITLLAIICAHNSVWTSYLQNEALEKRLTPIHKINKTDDVWAWFRGRFSDAVYPKLFYNGDVRLDEARSFMNDDVSYRIGLARIRQIRVKGWTAFNPKKCNGSEWTFKNEDETNSLTIFSNHDVYGGGGYVKILDQSVKEVRNDLYAMQAYGWIDLYTRLIVVEFVLYNPDSKLFSLPTITIEMPQTGGYYLTVKIKTARLYPYIDTFDFFVLGFQLLFLIITFCKFVTFDIIDVMDSAYKVCISVELFVAVLNLLRPLTFNYNIYLMRTSISLCAKDLMSFGICILVPMSGFAILCFVCVGPYQMDFRDIFTAFITLFRTLLAMVKIRDTFGENDIAISFGFSVFLFVMTILMVNFCISILNDAFSYVKKKKPMSSDIDAYDMELHNHFWRKINDALKIFQRKQKTTDAIVEDKAGVLGLSMTLDNQIFRIVSQVERAYRNEETFQKKYKSMMNKLPKKSLVLEYEDTSFSFRFDDISEESDSDTYSNYYNLP
ncbi:polycystin-2-like, partial [Mizuhopecten yessoensis]|uniref:polycystin-2-like n=1 Tax=Mizuhopecten yessoensis TaxID=6573 RepID=UPI000B45E749